MCDVMDGGRRAVCSAPLVGQACQRAGPSFSATKGRHAAGARRRVRGTAAAVLGGRGAGCGGD